MVYPTERTLDEPADLLAPHPEADTVVVVRSAYDLDGPGLRAADRERPDAVRSLSWADLAATLGAPVPWWPTVLRRADHLTGWRPGDDPRPVTVRTDPPWEALYALAATEPAGSPVRHACYTIGHRIRAEAAEAATRQTLQLRTWIARRVTPFPMVFPAVPDPTDPGLDEVATDDIVGAGLAELCARTDEVALECLEHVSAWSGSEDLPYGGTFRLTRRNPTRAAAEWINRLSEVPATALHLLEEADHEIVGTFVDPVTGGPVVAVKGRHTSRDDREISYIGRAPKRLPAGSVLKEIILDTPIWVRTADRTVHPVPAMDAPGLNWGYSGSGPHTLAECVGRLLDDGAAPAVTYEDDGRAAEPGLTALFSREHPSGTRFTRRQLEQARRTP
ncbi:hypothetical protein [Streptomyces sp. NPDC097619]|uniref:hypothetical protein n=1 Tax=Streptomyces sp. NPDC097619 TaxID=3157228 RepID=UPI00331D44E9